MGEDQVEAGGVHGAHNRVMRNGAVGKAGFGQGLGQMRIKFKWCS